MAPLRPAAVAYVKTSSCFINIPAKWKCTCPQDKVVCFEVTHGERVSYFSWAGGLSLSNNAYDDAIEIDGLYAQKLGIEKGQQVLVKEMAFVSSCSRVYVEPVSSVDWEILESNCELVRSRLLNQVRVLFLDQVLPVWLNSGVPLFLLVTKLSCKSSMGQINQSTELHVKPKFIDSGIGLGSETSSVVASPSTAASSPVFGTPTLSDHVSDVTSTAPVTSTPDLRSSLLSRLCKYVLGLETGVDGLSPVKASIDEGSEKRIQYWNKYGRWKLPFRVSVLPTNVDDCVSDGHSTLHTLMRQSTTVFVSAKSLSFLDGDDESHNAILVQMQKISSPEQKLEDKIKFRGHSIEQTFDSVADALSCETFLKMVTVESLSTESCKCMKALGQALSFPNRVVVSPLMCSTLNLELGVRVLVEAQDCCIQDVSKVIVKRFKAQPSEVELLSLESIKKSLNEAAEVGCPLVLNPRTPMLLNINGKQEPVLLSLTKQCTRKQEMETIAYQLVSLQHDRDVTCRFTDKAPLLLKENLKNVDSNERLGSVDDLIAEGLRFLKLGLELSCLTQSLSVSGTSKCMAIVGPRGSGKSALARNLCRKLAAFPYHVHFEVIHCKQLKGKRVDGIYKMWKKVFAQAVYKFPSIVVFDDLDYLCRSSSTPGADAVEAVQEQIATLLIDLLKYEIPCTSPVAVLATCCSKALLHPLLVSTRGCHIFTKFLVLEPLGLDQRVEVLKSLILQKKNLPLNSVQCCNLTEVAKRTEGAVAQDLKLLVDKAVYSACSDSKCKDQLVLNYNNFEWALSIFTPSNLKGVAKNLKMLNKSWADVGGLGEVKKTLEETFFWPTKYPNLFVQCPLRLSTGLLLYGPPGTGKTLLAGAVAKECALNFISIKGPELLSKYIGASEQAVRDLFYKAQSAKPCILFFDEFDAIAPRRGHDSTGVTDRVVNQLLTQMDGVEERTGVYVLAATSRPDLIDPALLRPGRLDKCLHCPLPTKDEQLKIFRILSRSLNLDPDMDWTEVGDNWDSFSGADLQALLFDAQLLAIREVPTSAVNEDLERINEGILQWFCVPNLEEGCAKELLPEKKDSLHKELETIVNQQKRSGVCDDPDAKTTRLGTCRVTILQRHLIEAAQKLKPSVSPAERFRYQRIYETFVESRGGDFSKVTPKDVKRATFA